MSEGESLWIKWAREIQAIGQTGLHFSNNEFDLIRYKRLVEIASCIFSNYTGQPAQFYAQDFLNQIGYATPKIDVRGAVFQNDRILMVQERSDNGWSLPGGWADVNEPPSKMIEREVLEESGYEVYARKVVGVYEANRDREPISVYYAYKLVFLCEITGGEARPSNETSSVGFFPLDDLPVLSQHRTQPRYIQEAFFHLKEPNRVTAFD